MAALPDMGGLCVCTGHAARRLLSQAYESLDKALPQLLAPCASSVQPAPRRANLSLAATRGPSQREVPRSWSRCILLRCGFDAAQVAQTDTAGAVRKELRSALDLAARPFVRLGEPVVRKVSSSSSPFPTLGVGSALQGHLRLAMTWPPGASSRRKGERWPGPPKFWSPR